MVVTRGGSLSPSPKGSPSANRKVSGKKKVIAFKFKQVKVGSELAKRKELEDDSHRKKKKAKRQLPFSRH